MSALMFNHYLNRIQQLRQLKGNNLSVVIDSRFPHINGRTLFLNEKGELSTDLLTAVFNVSADNPIITNNKNLCISPIYDSDIENIVLATMNENQNHMDHLSYHPEDWEHVE